ncbi:DUF6595 domain-containing protein [Microdochium nivale]|nr:DUF6595 domain-containing protein [Microdochium nivale]
MRSTTCSVLAAALAGAQIASAHFGIIYPPWRADTLSEAGEEVYSQWDRPCAGANVTANRTAYPIGGGAIELELHHAWSYVWVNLGLGESANFNISLTPDLYNISGKGDFCWPKLPIPVEIADGTNATIQVVTGGANGQALYNCADITFRANAPVHQCQNSTQFNVTVIRDGVAIVGGPTNTTTSGVTTSPPATTTKPAAGVSVGVSLATLSTAAGIALVFALGL